MSPVTVCGAESLFVQTTVSPFLIVIDGWLKAKSLIVMFLVVGTGAVTGVGADVGFGVVIGIGVRVGDGFGNDSGVGLGVGDGYSVVSGLPP